MKVKYFDENVYKKLTMNLSGMTLHQLKFILAVARHGSLVKAAKALSLSTPTLSLQLKKLSETAGAPLFEMLGKKLYLTSTGALMLRCAQDIEARIEELSQEIAALKGLKEGELKVAILTTLKYTVPRLVGSFCVNYPGITISLWIGNREALLDRLRKNEDDLYVMGQPPDELNVVAEQFAPNPLVLVAHPSNPIAKKRLVKPADLANELFIVREAGSGTRLTTESFFKKYRVRLQTRLEVVSNEAVKHIVAGGLGVAVLSSSTVASEVALGELSVVKLEGFPLMRQWNLVYPSGRRLSPAATRFKAWLKAYRPEAAALPTRKKTSP